MHLRSWLKNGAALIILALIASFGIIFNSATSWLVTDAALVVALILALSLVWPLGTLRANGDETTAADDATGPQLTLSGPGFFPLLALRQGKQTLARQAYVGRPIQATLPKPLARGRYETLPLRVVCGDPFGWTEKQRGLKLREPLVVGPRRELALSSAVHGVLTRLLNQNAPSGDAPSFDLRAFREYVPGDPVNAIDWKATAKRDEMIVRLDEPEERPHWQGVLLAEDAPLFENLLGVFVTLSTRGDLWQNAAVVDETIHPVPTGAALATLTPVARADVGQLATLPQQGLIIFASPEMTVASLGAIAEKRPVILVQLSRGENRRVQATISAGSWATIVEGGGGDAA
ncbi:DUF58 domain-containing protein [Lacticaseibacillus mingshuiensis]|uniref:DUF58 domain-containing protein n=1 Tax=Lacticaseibacillus mingshuiensis TaxID=2799574 RepID=A0ABW4CGQ3_9LACO|nr:DUF58 domain-containing protein [Lacticaseibacillus mingshuiensis]